MVSEGNLSEFTIIQGDPYSEIEVLTKDSIDCIFTAPNSPQPRTKDDVYKLIEFFEKVKPIITDLGSCYVQLGDMHDQRGSLTGITALFYLGILTGGWTVRSELTWYREDQDSKMEDEMRFKRDCEKIYFFAPDKNHYFNDKIGMHKTSLMSYRTEKVRLNEFRSKIPIEMIQRLLKVATRPGDIVLDPFCDVGAVGIAALNIGRSFIGIERRESFIPLLEKKLSNFGRKSTPLATTV